MNIVVIPNPVLFQKAKPVTRITPRLRKLVSSMEIALRRADNPKGVGLAAPQVGKSLQLFIIRLKDNEPLSVFIDPKIVKRSETLNEKPDLLEGCLSIPGIWGPVNRHQEVTVHYKTLDGNTVESTYSGLMATTIEHEMDHLEGMLFTARVVEQSGKLYRLEKDAEGKDVFEEIKI